MRFLIAVLVLLGLAGVLTGCASPTFTLQLGSTAVTIVRGGSGSVTVVPAMPEASGRQRAPPSSDTSTLLACSALSGSSIVHVTVNG